MSLPVYLWRKQNVSFYDHLSAVRAIAEHAPLLLQKTHSNRWLHRSPLRVRLKFMAALRLMVEGKI